MAAALEGIEVVDLTCIGPGPFCTVVLGDHPQIRARGMVVVREHPVLGVVKQPGSALKRSDTPPSLRWLMPALGGHTDDVLRRIGYADERIEALRREGAV